MSQTNKALSLVVTRLGEGATGEIIVAGEDLEAHVYLQAGRIAWAYSSQQRGAFLREIMEVAALDHEAVSEVLRECRTHRKHVAETLIEWGLVQERDMRRALWNQLAETLRLVALEPESEALFLRREQTPYDERLTFSLTEFDRESFSTRPLSGEETELLAREAELRQTLSESIPTSLWLKLVKPGGRSSSTGAILGVVGELLDADKVLECAYRESVGWLYGLRQPEGYLFCGLRPDMPLTRARGALRPGPVPVAIASPLVLGPLVDAPVPAALGALAAMLASLDFVAGAFLCTRGGTVSLLRQGAPAGLTDQVTRLSALFGLPLAALIQPSPSSSLLRVSPAARVVLPGVHLLGSPIGEASLWLALCPSVREGFGWGLLTNALVALGEAA